MTAALRLGVVGAGAITRLRHLPAICLHPDKVRITAVTDMLPGAALSLAEQIGGASVFNDLDSLLKSGEIDAAIVATPHFLHFEQAHRLMEAGVPALVEKPLVTRLDDLRRLRSASERTGTLLVSGQMQRFDPVNVLARRWIESDPSRFGDLVSFSMRSWQDITEYTAHAGSGHWLLDGARAGGGVVVSLAVHQLDLLRYLSGVDYAEVTAVGRFAKPFYGGAESSAVVLLTMSNGAVGTLNSTYAAPRGFQSESLSLFGEHGGFSRAFQDQGSYHGPLLYSSAHDWDIVDFSSESARQELGLVSDLGSDPFENQILHFVSAVRGEAPPINTVVENFNTVACLAAINEALLAPGSAISIPTT